MSITNRVSMVIGDDDRNQILQAIQVIKSKLPYLITLSDEERQNIPKMGDKTVSFVNKCYEYAQQNPGIVPRFLDLEEFKKDTEVVKQLFQIYAPLQKLVEELDDTMMMAGSEAYAAALVFYSALKTALNSGETGMKNIYEELSTRFPGRPPKSLEKPSGSK